MGSVGYAVAGEPIAHSLSPLLFSLVCAHLKEAGDSQGVRNTPTTPEVTRMDLVPTSRVEDALAWGYVGSYPGGGPDWSPVGSQIHAFRAKALIERAINAVKETAAEVPDSLKPIAEAHLPVGDDNIPGNHVEMWLSLTAPLKHQLSSAAIRHVDDSREFDSVNTLRWNSREWWVASTDGLGLVHVAEQRGIVVDGGAILELHGGGGAARSCATAWVANGGRLRWTGGRRDLSAEGPWALGLVGPEGGDAVFSTNFDIAAGVQVRSEDEGLSLNPAYGELEGELEQRIAALTTGGLDGRWMLCAQHLCAWSLLWCPERAEDLPTLEVLLHELVQAELILESYRLS